MDPFDKPYWSRLQVELWVCTRSREAVRLAAHAPGNTNLADLSLGTDGADDERLDDDPPLFDDEAELIGEAIIKYGWVCSFDDARQQVIVASAKDELRAYPDAEGGNSDGQVFVRANVLELWPEIYADETPGTTPRTPLGDAPARATAQPAVAKRKGGRPAPWVKHLRKYLRLRLERRHDLESMSLAELRRDFLNYAMQHRISKIPKSRAALETQINKVLPQVIVEHREQEQGQHAAASPIDEVTRPPEIRRK